MGPFQGFFSGVGNAIHSGAQALENTAGGIGKAIGNVVTPQQQQPTPAAPQMVSQMFQNQPAPAAPAPAQPVNTQGGAPTATNAPANYTPLQDVGNTILQAAQSIPRSAVSLGLTLTGKKQFDPANPISKMILGGAPVQNIAGESPATAAILEKYAGMDPESAKAIAPFATGVLDLANVLPGEGALRSVLTSDAAKSTFATVKNTSKEAMTNAAAQPGGLQAGFLGHLQDPAAGETPAIPVQSSSAPLPEEPSGTSVQYNKDGTEAIVPPDQHTNPAQYAQTPPEPAAPQFSGGQAPVEPPAAPINNREAFQNPAPPSNIPAVDQIKTGPEASLPGGDPKQIPQRSIDMLDNTYTVPARKALGSLQKIQTYRGILAHIKSGMEPASIEQMPHLVSDSQTGLVPKMIREVASNIKEPIPLKDPGEAAQNVMDQHKLFIDDKTAGAIRSDITSALPKSEDGKTVDPTDAMQYARELETRAAEIRQGDNYLTNRGDKRFMAQSLNAAADDVWDQIGAHVTPEDLDKVKTPERMDYLKSLSPRLGAQVEAAKNIPQLRSTIRDFVRMGQIVDQTDASSGSVFGKVGRMGLGSRGQNVLQGIGLGAKALYNPAGAAADVAKMGAQKAAGMFDESPRDALLKSLQEEPSGPQARFAGGKSPVSGETGATSKGMNPTVKKVGLTAGIGAIGLGAVGGGIEKLNQSSNAASQDPTGNSDNSHGVSISNNLTKSQDGSLQLPKSVSQPTGQYMTNDQRLSLEQNLTPGTPQYERIEQQFAQSQKMATAALPGGSMEFMKNAPQYVAVGNVIQGDISKLPTNFLNKFKTWSAVQAYASNSNNPYAGELADLDAMNTQFAAAYNQVNGANPGANQLITSGDSTTQLQAKWTQMMNFIGNSYAQRLEPYQALTAGAGAAAPNGQPISGTTPPPQASPPNASAVMGGQNPGVSVPQFSGGAAAISPQ